MTCSIALPDASAHLSATDIGDACKGMTALQRDVAFRDFLLAGHVPAHMREFVDVTFAFVDAIKKPHELTLRVLPDYLCLGHDADWVRAPLSPMTAQPVADAWNCMLPTTKMVQLIWAAGQKEAPLPWGPPYDHSMQSLQRVFEHTKRINSAMVKNNHALQQLTSGHKKDVVMTNRLVAQPKQVAIFGWIQLNGKEIQPLSCVHEALYADYSHGIRLLSKTCVLDGQETELKTVLEDKVMHVSVSSEGPLKVLRQPGT